jgi:gluconolactonase
MAAVLKTTVEVLAAHYGGREFNSPNDIVCDSRDRIWFIDPAFGRTNPRVGVLGEQQLDFQGVFRIETDGTFIERNNPTVQIEIRLF